MEDQRSGGSAKGTQTHSDNKPRQKSAAWPDPGVRKMLAVFDETDMTVHYYGQDGPVRTKLRKLRDLAQTGGDESQKSTTASGSRLFSGLQETVD